MIFGTNRTLSPALALVLAFPAFTATLAAQTAPPAVATYTIDPVHSSAEFKIKHLLVSTISGQFDKVEGTVTLDTKAVAKSSVNVVIDTTSINTIGIGHDARDKHLKSADFFDVETFPTITFKSTSVKKVKDQLNVVGTFTMHGVTKTIEIPVTQEGPVAGMKPGSFVVGFNGNLKLNRSEYGMTKMIGPIGDEVTVTLNVEADLNPAN
jgi:polyisoprenoid-binding protein YceI